MNSQIAHARGVPVPPLEEPLLLLLPPELPLDPAPPSKGG
jgi:hypothetical protein